MTQDELRLEEICQSIRLAYKDKIAIWSEEAVKDAVDGHLVRLGGDTPALERRELLEKGLDDVLNHKMKRQMREVAMDTLREAELFTKEQLQILKGNLGLLMDRWKLSCSVSVPESFQLLEPARSSVAIAIFCFVGLFLGNQFETKPNGIGLLFSFLFAMLGAYSLTLIQRKILLSSASSSWMVKAFTLLSSRSNTGDDWLNEPKRLVRDSLESGSEVMVTLVQCVGQIELLKSEHRDEDTDILQHFFSKCLDGFSEVYYSEIKRDPERALDACIKLVGDIKNAGVEIKTVERDEAYDPDWEGLFASSGRLKEKDPVMMIHPAWLYQGRILAKGRLKQSKKKSS